MAETDNAFGDQTPAKAESRRVNIIINRIEILPNSNCNSSTTARNVRNVCFLAV